MKDYKLLAVSLLTVLLIIAIGLFAWLWHNNRKTINPLPIAVSQNEQAALDNINTAPITILQVQADQKMQIVLNDLVDKFKQRYPNVQLLVHYVPTSSLFLLADTKADTNAPSQQHSDVMVDRDVIIADGKITQSQLSLLQDVLNKAQSKRNASNGNGMAQETNQPNNIVPSMINDNNQARHLASFNYAIKNGQTIDGIILTENPIASNFRNFLLSSSGQDVLKQHGYDDIDGYKNSVNELFNPASSHKQARGESSVKLAEALSNGKE